MVYIVWVLSKGTHMFLLKFWRPIAGGSGSSSSSSSSSRSRSRSRSRSPGRSRSRSRSSSSSSPSSSSPSSSSPSSSSPSSSSPSSSSSSSSSGSGEMLQACKNQWQQTAVPCFFMKIEVSKGWVAAAAISSYFLWGPNSPVIFCRGQNKSMHFRMK